MKILVTGAAGFIGSHVSASLIEHGHDVVGADNINDYYEPALKKARLEQVVGNKSFEFCELDVGDRQAVETLFSQHDFDRVIHLAAQAGVRYSLENPHAYGDTNLIGFLNILESCRHAKTPHLVFASSSSVYGANTTQPYATNQSTEHPLSLYAATKKANEMMAHSYAHLYRMPVTGLRFFTVYGPWGRPDMAYFSFTKKILAGETIDVFNNGHHARDFTFIDDIVEGVVRVMDHIPQPDSDWDSNNPKVATSTAPYQLFNIGNSEPIQLMEFISSIEEALGIEAKKNFLPMQPGDVEATSADVSDLRTAVDFAPNTPLKEGMAKFIDWYRTYHGNSG